MPEPNVDDGYGSSDASNDSQILTDGELPDGRAPDDGAVTPDGSVADSGHDLCGDAGKDCGAGECLNGVCQAYPITTDINNPRKIIYSGSLAYVMSGLQLIYSLDIGGTPNKVTSTEVALSAMAVSGSTIYFSNMGSGSAVNTDGKVSSCEISGCVSATRKDYVVGSRHQIAGVAVDGTNVYYGVDDLTGGAAGGGIYTCPLGIAPCTATTPTLSFQHAANLQLAGTNTLYFLGNASVEGPFHCAATSCTASSGNDNLGVVDYAVGTTNVVFATQQTISYEAIGSVTVTPVYGSQTQDVAIGIDDSDTYVYWLDAKTAPNGVLNRCTIADQCFGGPTTMAEGLNDPTDLVVTSDSIWFTTNGDHTVWRIAL